MPSPISPTPRFSRISKPVILFLRTTISQTTFLRNTFTRATISRATISRATGKRFVHVFIALMVVCLTIAPAWVAAAPAQQDADLVDTAAANADFSTLVAAIQAAGLADSLKSGGPYTIFAPTNGAFDALSGRLEELLADPAGDLTQILLYHVVSGVVTAEDLTDGAQLTTLQGGTIQVTVTGEAVQVNTANVVTLDIEASNGVIHVIDMVLTPPSADEAAIDEAATDEATAEEPEAESEAAAPEAIEEAAPEATPEATTEATEEAATEEATAEEAAAEEATAEEATEAPSVTVVDQESEGAQVLVPTAFSDGPGWMVIHADVDGRPGPVLGQTAVAPGTNNNIVVLLNQPASGETTLWAMLHIDAGQVGVYEFPGPDVPAQVDDAIVMLPFVVNAPAATAGAEATGAAGEEADAGAEAESVVPEPTESAPGAATSGTDSGGTGAGEPSSPAQMPTTGGTLPAGVSIGIVAAVVTLLAGAAYVTRRRTV